MKHIFPLTFLSNGMPLGQTNCQTDRKEICFASATYLIYVQAGGHYSLIEMLYMLSKSTVLRPLKASVSMLGRWQQVSKEVGADVKQ